MDSDGYWTFAEWLDATSAKLAAASVSITSERDRADYLRVQVRAAAMQAWRHGQSGRTEHDPVTP